MRELERNSTAQLADLPRKATAVALMVLGMFVLALEPKRRP